MTDHATGVHVLTFEDFEAAAQLREIEHRRPTRAKRMIMRCPACGNDDRKIGLVVLARDGYVFLNCDNDCPPLDIVHALNLDGVLRAPDMGGGDDLAGQHGNQLRIAYMFAEDFAGKLIHVHGIGWLWWDGKHWVEDAGDKYARDMVPRTLRRAITTADTNGDQELRKSAARCETSAGIGGVLHIASAMPEFRINHEQLDADPYLLNCANGTLDLRELELRSHNPADLLTKITEASYVEDATGKTWQRLLEEVLPNEAVRDCFQRLIGMSLIGRQEQHVLPLMTGVGANGKSTVINALLFAFGLYAMAADPNLLTEGKTSSVGKVDLMGTRLAVVSETDKGARMAEATAKALTGGDRIKARKLYQDWIEFTPSHTLMMVTNHPPAVNGDDAATWRRLMVIRFDVVIPEDKRDGNLPERLQLDAEAILAWAVQGLADYQVDGLNPPAEVSAATAEYRARCDHVGRFLAECCVTSSPVFKVEAARLHEAWLKWSAAEDCEPMGRNSFHDAIKQRPGLRLARSNGARWFEGVRLKTAVELENDTEGA